MRLKKIALRGFKSFADATTLEFHPGITAIVGPNGCGKSNIADAFRWVVGEQSAKSLRGGKMQDVLFAGAAQRHPVAIAEVMLVLEEINGALPTSCEEVSIMRRLHKNGNSDYLLNGNEMRLKDLQSFFFDSGIGKEAFSIFEQGKIEQVIHWTPVERRSLFEEAAGIVRFLHRKREALQKLDQTEQNLSRVVDVQEEVLQRLKVLEQQSAVALRYRELESSLALLERQIAVARWRASDAKRAEVQTAIEKVQEQLNQFSISRDVFFTASEASKKALQEQADICSIAQKNVQDLRGEQAVRQREHAHTVQRQRELIAQLKQWEEELQGITERLRSADKELHQLLSQHRGFQDEVSNRQRLFEAAKASFEGQSRSLDELRRNQQERHRDSLALTKSHSALEGDLKQQQVRLEGYKSQLNQLVQRQEKLVKQEKDAVANSGSKSSELAALSAEIELKKKQLDQSDLLLAELKGNIELHRRRHEEVRRNEAQTSAKLKALEELRAALEGISEGCRRLLRASNDKKSPLYGKLKPLYELCKPSLGREKALAAILQQYAHTVVAQKREDIALAMAFAKEQRCGDFSLFCAEELSSGGWEEHFTGDLVIADSIEAATLEKRTIWVEKEGFFIDPRRVLFAAQQGDANVFSREASIRELKEQQAIAIEERTVATAALEGAQQRQAQLQGERGVIDKAMRTQEIKLVEVNHALLRFQEEARRCQQEQQQLIAEEGSVRQKMTELEVLLKGLQTSYEASALKLKEASHTGHSEDKKLEMAVEASKKGQVARDENERLWRAAVGREKQCGHSIEVLKVKFNEGEARAQQLQKEREKASSALSAIEQQAVIDEEFLKKLQVAIEESERVLKAQEARLLEVKRELQKQQGELQRVEGDIKTAETEQHRIALQLSQLQTAQELLDASFKERYEVEIASCIDAQGCSDIPTAEKRSRHLRKELEGCGDVNFAAIEECKKEKERHDFLFNQVADLMAAKKQLLDIINDLDQQSRKKFQEAFDSIRANFQKNFSLLFNGGEADLTLIDAADILTAGIEISAKPPGKQMRSLTLLSGGEKCLTSMALLFAIFEIKPAPYCILDEIDAPLDDTNVERFASVLKQFTNRCQFIIITHNKRTMSIADRIYGVSMQEKGVSRLLKMEFVKDDIHVCV